jgi:PAT family beta-lactamase induction signal transducer AmpG
MKPYAWIPTLYFAEAVPYMAVMTLSVIMYTRLGLSNTELALYTSWLYLPWVIKPLWSPLVDQWRTKRWWILSMQVLVGGALAGVALTLPMAMWLRASLAFFWLMAFSSATHDIAADGFYILSLSQEDQALYVGIRSTFYRIGSIFCQGLLVMVAGWLESRHSVPMAWSITMLLMGAIMIGLAGWHFLSLPKEETEPRQEGLGLIDYTFRPFAETLKAFFSKPHIWAALLFMLLFRLPEAQLAKMAQPFMLRPLAEGGLELGTATVGFAYGTLGVIGLLAGGIIGGWVVSKHGLRRWLWPMVIAISIPDVVYIYLAYAQPSSLWIINACVFIEQFGYGFGFTAYMLFLVYFSRGERSTSVFALCTAFQALGMMLPGMAAGWLADAMGFCHFFIFVCLCTLVTFAVSGLIRRDLK